MADEVTWDEGGLPQGMSELLVDADFEALTSVPGSPALPVITVAITDAHPVTLVGLHGLLSEHDDVNVVVSAPTVEELVTRLDVTPAQVIVLGWPVGVPDGATINLLAQRAAVVVYANTVDEPSLVRCIDAGAMGSVFRGSSAGELVRCVRGVVHGTGGLDGYATRAMVNHVRHPAGRSGAAKSVLTTRELEAVTLAAEGCTNQQIAARLFISPQTVKSHMKATYRKLGVPDRASAVARVMRDGLLV